MKVQRLLAVILTAAALLTGCTSLSLSGTDILAPPKAAGSRAEIQSMIEKDSKGSYSLIYPSSGAYKSGIVLHDLNGDDTDEAAALYTASDGTPRLLIAVLQDGSYRLFGSTELRSANVSDLSFADVNADGTEELIIGFDVGTPRSALQSFTVGDGVGRTDIAEGFKGYVTGDFDGNSSADILLLTHSSDDTAAARLMVYSEDGFVEKSSCDIDAEVVSYINPQFGRFCEDAEGAIADGVLNDGSYTTQLLYYDSAAHMLLNPLFQNTGYGESTRSCAVTCADIDGDGVVEVPLCSLTAHGKDEDLSAVCSIVHWSGYDSDSLTLSFEEDALLCEKLGFMLMLDAETLSDITARYTADNAVTLYGVNDKDGDAVISGALMIIKRYEKNSYDSSLTAEAVLGESAAYIYTYILSEGSTFTHEEIENSFRLLGTDSK